ncbi:uncharacterized protein LOC135576212 [Columba livia]|uniref:uncharacterized protein LOC135576212 n=1 Tax=Columba livia TaxID=8932 RepID=UPI0031B9C746
MRWCRGAGLAGLAAVLLVAGARAQVQQDLSAETTEGTGISINCSHPKIQSNEVIYWYSQLPGRGPAFLTLGIKDSKVLSDPPGWLSVAADRRSSALWLERPRRGDAAVYYCAVGDTGRRAGAAAGHEPPREGPGGCGGVGVTVPVGSARGRCHSARRHILTPQNHRMVGVGRDLWRSSSPTHLLKQVHQSRSHRNASRTKMDGHKQTRTWMGCIEDNFLMQTFREWTWREALLDLLLTNEEELLDDVEFKGSLACSDQETVEFKIYRGLTKSNTAITSPTPGEHVTVSTGPYLLAVCCEKLY